MIDVDDILRETVQKLYNVYFWTSKLIKFCFRPSMSCCDETMTYFSERLKQVIFINTFYVHTFDNLFQFHQLYFTLKETSELENVSRFD